jgi:hypothetical protein
VASFGGTERGRTIRQSVSGNAAVAWLCSLSGFLALLLIAVTLIQSPFAALPCRCGQQHMDGDFVARFSTSDSFWWGDSNFSTLSDAGMAEAAVANDMSNHQGMVSAPVEKAWVAANTAPSSPHWAVLPSARSGALPGPAAVSAAMPLIPALFHSNHYAAQKSVIVIRV